MTKENKKKMMREEMKKTRIRVRKSLKIKVKHNTMSTARNATCASNENMIGGAAAVVTASALIVDLAYLSTMFTIVPRREKVLPAKEQRSTSDIASSVWYLTLY